MTKTNDLNIITIASLKGGAGKTTTAHNLGEWLASEGYSTLFVDKDWSMSLTKRYIIDVEPPIESNISGIYQGLSFDKIKPLRVKENLDLIASTKEAFVIEDKLSSKIQRELIFLKWVGSNFEELNGAYDYIVIDTRNNDRLFTINSLASADIVVGVTDTSIDGYEELDNLRYKMSELSEAYDLELNFKIIATQTVKKQKVTQDLVKVLRRSDDFIGCFENNVNAKVPTSLIEQAGNDIMSTVQENRLHEMVQLFKKIIGD